MLVFGNITLPYIQRLFKIINKNEFLWSGFTNKILINAFFEPSTRTSLSFESAMYRLGGNVITFQPDTSSIQKGESFKDTIKTLACYGDAIVIRHPSNDFVNEIANTIDVPIINGGNGSGEHPTQALLDLYTIHQHLQKIKFHHELTYLNNSETENTSPLCFLFIGDIANSRTIHSLLHLLFQFKNILIHFLPYPNCEPVYGLKAKTFFHSVGMEIIVNEATVDPSQYDVIYVTRFQKERHSSENISKSNITINRNFMNRVKKTAIVMHPLPRNEEIDPDIDDDPRCVYFKQMENGVLVRMAILQDLFTN